MALKFLNKKGWHTGSLRNIENVWKAEQKHDAEEKKLDELKKQIDEERERAEFRLLQERAGLVPRQERLDFLYESGLGVGKGNSEGFQTLQAPSSAAGPSSATAETGVASKASAPGALFEEKPQSANDTWRKLHSDPLLLIRQREQEALARIKSNPIQMAMIRKSVDAEKKHKVNSGGKKDKRRKKEHKKKHHYSKSKHSKHSSKGHSDSEDSTDVREEVRKKEYPTFERDSDNNSKHDKYSVRTHSDYADANEMGGKRKGGHAEHDVAFKEMEGRRHGDHRSYEVKREVDGRRHKHQTHEESIIEVEERGQRDHPKYEKCRKEMERGRERRDGRTYKEESAVVEGRRHKRHRVYEVSNEVEGKRQRNRPVSDHCREETGLTDRHRSRVHSNLSNSFHETGSDVRMSSDNGYTGGNRISESKRSGYNHGQAAPKLSAEERAARLREMQVNAELHEEQRWKRLKKASEVDAKEENKDRPSLKGSNFLDAAQKSIYGTERGGSSTVEESVRRRTYYLQGGAEANESNAFRR